MDRRSPQRSGIEGELSVSSAIDLPTGLGSASSEPQTPVSLSPSREGSVSRRRLSWGRMERQNVEAFSDPLRLNWGETTRVRQGDENAIVDDDPFELDPPMTDDFIPSRSPRERYPMTRINGPSISSQASLVPSFRTTSTTSADFNDLDIDDDEARLTSFASTSAGQERSRSMHLDPSTASGVDIERTPDSRASKRRSARYSLTPSPASRLRSMTHTLRRVSVRVVNLAGRGLEDKVQPIRLPDDHDERGPVPEQMKRDERAKVEDEEEEEELPDMEARMPLRGRTLGLFDSSSSIRLTTYRFLTYTCVPVLPPGIFLLTTIFQMDRTDYLTSHHLQRRHSHCTCCEVHHPPRQSRWFFAASSCCQRLLPCLGGLPVVHFVYLIHVRSRNCFRLSLVVLMILNRLEAFARIITSGFVLDPEVPVSALFKSPFSNLSATYMPSPTVTSRDPHSNSFTMQNASFSSNVTRSNSQNGGPKFNHILRQLRRNLVRPFALSHHQASAPTLLAPPVPSLHSYSTDSVSRQNSGSLLSEKLKIGGGKSSSSLLHPSHPPAPSHIRDPRDPSKGTFFGRVLKSDALQHEVNEKEYLGLPFRLSVYTAQDHVVRNVPYLRHSWNRIDFIAILAFWISLGLAQGGVERSSGTHIAIFRALSVLRTSRLLAVTSGTTVRRDFKVHSV